MGLVIYSVSFRRPATWRAGGPNVLGAAGVRVDWRAIETNPRAPVGAAPLGVAGREALERGPPSGGATDLLIPGEELPRSLPTFGLNTRGAVAGGRGVGEAPASRTAYAACSSRRTGSGDSTSGAPRCSAGCSWGRSCAATPRRCR